MNNENINCMVLRRSAAALLDLCLVIGFAGNLGDGEEAGPEVRLSAAAPG